MHSRSWWTLHWEGAMTDNDSQFVAWNWQMNFRLFSVLLCVNIADSKVFENPKKKKRCVCRNSPEHERCCLLGIERWRLYSAPV